jgi:hypothetical protein
MSPRSAGAMQRGRRALPRHASDLRRILVGPRGASGAYTPMLQARVAWLIWTVASPEAAFVYIAAWMLLAFAGLASFR